MIKIGIAVIFFAELIFFINIIYLIVKLDKAVVKISKSVMNLGVEIRVVFQDIKAVLQDFVNIVKTLQIKIEERRYEYSKKMIKTSLFYLSLILLRGNYKKVFILYNLCKDIYSGYKLGINLI